MECALAAGIYNFSFREQVSHGNGGSLMGDFELILSRQHPPHGGGNHVPEAGSSGMMLGMALGVLGGLARRVKA